MGWESLIPIALGAFGIGKQDKVEAPAQTAQYNPWYDQMLQAYMTDKTKAPAGFVKPEDYNFMGQQVKPGAMKQYGDFSSTMNPVMDQIMATLGQLQGAGVGYQGSEIQAMNDTLNRQLADQAQKSRMQVGGSMAARGLRGGAMNNAMIANENNIMNANAQGRRDILLGTAEARRKDLNDKFGLINNTLQLGSDVSGKQATLQSDANQKNIGTWNDLADPMKYQKFITDALLAGSGAAATTGSLGASQAKLGLDAASQNAAQNKDYWSGLFWGADKIQNRNSAKAKTPSVNNYSLFG